MEGAAAYLGGCHCLSRGSHSDNKASLSSSETAFELSTGTELCKSGRNVKHGPMKSGILHCILE